VKECTQEIKERKGFEAGRQEKEELLFEEQEARQKHCTN